LEELLPLAKDDLWHNGRWRQISEEAYTNLILAKCVGRCKLSILFTQLVIIIVWKACGNIVYMLNL
jgi:hypothetical protein